MTAVQRVLAGVAIALGFIGGAVGILLFEEIALGLGLPVALVVLVKGIR